MFRILRTGFLAVRANSSSASQIVKDGNFMGMINDVLREDIIAKSDESSATRLKFSSADELLSWVNGRNALSVDELKDVMITVPGFHTDESSVTNIVEKSWGLVESKWNGKDCLPLLTTLLRLNMTNTKCFKDLEVIWNENVQQLLKEENILPTILPFLHAANVNSYKISDNALTVIDTIINNQIRTLNKPSDLLTLLLHYQSSNGDWRNLAYKQAHQLLSIMSLSEIVGIIRCLGAHGRRDLHFLHPAIQRMTESSTSLSVQQIVDISSTLAKLRFFDARILRKVDIDLRKQINQLKSFNDVSSLVDSFSRLRLGNPDLWQCLANWVNANAKFIPPIVLSRIVGGFAVVGVEAAKPSAEILAKKLRKELATSETMWLNSIFALASHDALTTELAETVLHKEFIRRLFDNPKVSKANQIYFALKLLKVQQVVSNTFGNTYTGPTVSRSSFGIDFDSPEIIQQARLLRFGKGVDAYQDMFVKGGLQKIAPSSHFGGSCVTSSGIFVDEQVLIENGKLVSKALWTGREREVIPIIFVTWQQTAQNYADEKKKFVLLGSDQLSLKLLKEEGKNPICIYESELSKCSTQAEKISLLKKNLFESNEN
ncbi:unnamed protein product [Auanema sp. JU1783]|nr:unnamed protein product [Auanema sp. JU1783]